MRCRLSFASTILLALSSLSGFAQSNGSCAVPLSFALKTGSLLEITSRSAEIEVTGTDREEIRVTCSADDTEQTAKIHASFVSEGASDRLKITGGPSRNVRIRIEVPRRTDLRLNSPAGDLKVTNVLGNKDIHLHAGEISVSSVTEKEYGPVHASVAIGEIDFPRQGVNKGGFVRNYTTNLVEGKFRLDVAVFTGQINLQ
jgi:hypothetical protein